jgi:hypothetical protein
MSKIRNGSYPSDDEGLAALAGTVIKSKALIDPWGRHFQYRIEDRGEPVVWSLGADGIEASGDEIYHR